MIPSSLSSDTKSIDPRSRAALGAGGDRAGAPDPTFDTLLSDLGDDPATAGTAATITSSITGLGVVPKSQGNATSGAADPTQHATPPFGSDMMVLLAGQISRAPAATTDAGSDQDAPDTASPPASPSDPTLTDAHPDPTTAPLPLDLMAMLAAPSVAPVVTQNATAAATTSAPSPAGAIPQDRSRAGIETSTATPLISNVAVEVHFALPALTIPAPSATTSVAEIAQPARTSEVDADATASSDPTPAAIGASVVPKAGAAAGSANADLGATTAAIPPRTAADASTAQGPDLPPVEAPDSGPVAIVPPVEPNASAAAVPLMRPQWDQAAVAPLVGPQSIPAAAVPSFGPQSDAVAVVPPLESQTSPGTPPIVVSAPIAASGPPTEADVTGASVAAATPPPALIASLLAATPGAASPGIVRAAPMPRVSAEPPSDPSAPETTIFSTSAAVPSIAPAATSAAISAPTVVTPAAAFPGSIPAVPVAPQAHDDVAKSTAQPNLLAAAPLPANAAPEAAKSDAASATSQPDATAITGTLQAVAGAVRQLADTASADTAAPAGPQPTGQPAPSSLSPARTMTLQLNPADLGTVNVRLHLSGGNALDVQLSVSDEQTLGMITRERDALSDAINDQTYSLNSLVIQGTDAPTPVSEGNHATTQDKPAGDARPDQRQSSNGQDQTGRGPAQQQNREPNRAVPSRPAAAGGDDQLFV